MAAIKKHKQQMCAGRAFAVAKHAMEQVEWEPSQSQEKRKPEVPHRFEVAERWKFNTETGDSPWKAPKSVQSSAALADCCGDSFLICTFLPSNSSSCLSEGV